MLNKVMLIGNLGADPEVRYMPSGGAVTNINLATTRRWKDKQSGERKDATEWHRVVFFNRLAEVAGEYLKKAVKFILKGESKLASGKINLDRIDIPRKSLQQKCKCWVAVVVVLQTSETIRCNQQMPLPLQHPARHPNKTILTLRPRPLLMTLMTTSRSKIIRSVHK